MRLVALLQDADVLKIIQPARPNGFGSRSWITVCDLLRQGCTRAEWLQLCRRLYCLCAVSLHLYSETCASVRDNWSTQDSESARFPLVRFRSCEVFLE